MTLAIANTKPVIVAPACMVGEKPASPALRYAGQPPESKRVVLTVERLSRNFGSIPAVRGLSFDIHEGEIFGLLGPNGAGKSTTISILATMQHSSSGDATLLGRSVCESPYLVRKMIGLSPQELALYPKLTAAENLRFFGRLYSMEPTELQNRVDELLELVRLQSRRNDYVGTFSNGMKRRLNLAAALIHQPRLLLLDEPTAGVDPQSREHIFDIVRGLRASGSAILYTTHYMEEAEVLCDRLGIMDRGDLLAVGTLDELLARFDLGESIEIRGVPKEANLDSLRSTSGLLRFEKFEGLLRLTVRNAANFLGAIQELIECADQRVRVRIMPPTLEHVFLRVTGEELRD